MTILKTIRKNITLVIQHFFWVFPFVSFLIGYQLLSYFYGTDTFKTPAVIGKDIQEALTILSQHNLNPRLIATKEDADLPAGIIINQTPSPDTIIKAQQSIFLVITRKPDAPSAPNFLHRLIGSIEKEAQHNRLRIKSYYLPSNHPKDMCYAQYPTPGTKIPDQKMILYCSQGNHHPVLMPNFKNMPVPAVLDFLHGYDMQATIMHHHNNTQHTCTDACIIQDQRPLPGSLITVHDNKKPHVQLQVS